MLYFNILVSLFSVFQCILAQVVPKIDALGQSDASVASNARFKEIVSWQFPKKITCSLQATGTDTLGKRDLFSSTILRAMQNKANNNHCIPGSTDCTLTFGPERIKGDPENGWDPLYIRYSFWGNEKVGAFKFKAGLIYKVPVT